MNEDVLKKIKNLIISKNPMWGKGKIDNIIGFCVDGIREHIKNYKTLNELLDNMISDEKYRFKTDSFITAVKKNQGVLIISNQAKYNDFEPYKFGFVHISFYLSGEEPENQERINNEIELFSSFLANTKLIDYKSVDGRELKRHLTRTEYEEISNLRLSAGTGKLKNYSDVKFLDDKFQENLDKVSQITGPIINSMNAKFWYDETHLSAE